MAWRYFWTFWSILTVNLLTFSCGGDQNCPIECFCDTITSSVTCSGDPGVHTNFPKNFQKTSKITRFELHNYNLSYISTLNLNQWLFSFDSHKLIELSFRSCSIQFFENETFAQNLQILQNLQNLDLSSNQLTQFRGGQLLKGLKILDLSSNFLETVQNLGQMENLTSVNLSRNKISYLDPNLFQGLRKLQYINLDSNSFTSFPPQIFSNLPDLSHLILSYNPQLGIFLQGQGLMWNSPIKQLDLTSTGFSRIPQSLSKTIRDLRLSKNNISLVSTGDFDTFPNLENLNLDENIIEKIEDDAFGRLEYLTRLWINGNKLSRIPQNLPQSLTHLSLEQNFITNLTSTDLKNLKNLVELNLNSNHLWTITISDNFPNLKSFDISSNKIETLYKDSLSNLSGLQSLDLSSNPLKVIVNGALSHLTSLSYLQAANLNEPQIEFSTQSFQPLGNLQILNLSGSPSLSVKLLEESGLGYFPQLIDINLEKCALTDLNLVVIALLELVDHLKSVKLAKGNGWDCQDFDASQIVELYSKQILIDFESFLCAGPESVRGEKVIDVLTKNNISLISASNYTHLSSTTQLLSVTNSLELTTEVYMTEEITEIDRVTSPSTTTVQPRPPSESQEPPTRSYFFTDQEQQELQANQENLKEEMESSYPETSGDAGFIQKDPKIAKSHHHTGSSSGKKSGKKTRTNDDSSTKAIIDGKKGRKKGEIEKESIDGFPDKHPDNQQHPQQHHQLSKKQTSISPKLSFLRFGGSFGGKGHHQGHSSAGAGDIEGQDGTLILKTILISGVTCLASVFLLLVISYVVFRYIKLGPGDSTSDSRNNFFGLGRRNNCDPNKEIGGMAYSRLCGSASGGAEELELDFGGISNRLYFENEDIYHIT